MLTEYIPCSDDLARCYRADSTTALALAPGGWPAERQWPAWEAERCGYSGCGAVVREDVTIGGIR